MSIESKDDARDYIIAAWKKWMTVKAYGGRHSYSWDNATNDWAAETQTWLSSVLDLTESWLKDDETLKALKVKTDEYHLVSVNGGIKIQQLTKELDALWYGAINLGSYNQQSIVGAFSNSTHGSWVELWPISSAVCSLTLVTTDGKTYRIEPTNGITDPKKYKPTDDVTLIQDDTYFNSVVVSMGSMGIITSVILKVKTQYYLEETKTFTDNWETFWNDLIKNDYKLLKAHRHLELYINPNEYNGTHCAQKVMRNIIKKPLDLSKERPTLPWQEILKAIWAVFTLIDKNDDSFWKAIQTLIDVMNTWPLNEDNWAKTLRDGLKDSAKDATYKDVSYKVLKLFFNAYETTDSAIKAIPWFGIEVALDIKDAPQGMKTIFQFFKKKIKNKVYGTAPVTMRFVKSSDAYMSPQYGRTTVMLEILAIRGTRDDKKTLEELQSELLKIPGARMHWGLQMDNLELTQNDLRAIYPKFDDWLKVYQEFNSKKIFSNSFVERMHFDDKQWKGTNR